MGSSTASNGRRFTKDQCAAVVPIFNPEFSLLQCIQALQDNGIEEIVVVDDGAHSVRSTDPRILHALREHNVTTITNVENSGIAYSINQGIRSITKRVNVSTILTLDQDSIIDDGYVDRAIEYLNLVSKEGILVGAVSPQFVNQKEVRVEYVNDSFIHVFDPWQSGSIIPYSTFEVLGLLKEDLFIDCVDTEFNFRCRVHNYSLLAVPGINLTHELGAKIPLEVFGRQIVYRGKRRFRTVHSPFRSYYIVRNMLAVSSEYRTLFPDLVRKRSLSDSRSLLLSILLGPQRVKHLRAILCGVMDASRGRLGRIPTRLEKFLA